MTCKIYASFANYSPNLRACVCYLCLIVCIWHALTCEWTVLTQLSLSLLDISVHLLTLLFPCWFNLVNFSSANLSSIRDFMISDYYFTFASLTSSSLKWMRKLKINKFNRVSKTVGKCGFICSASILISHQKMFFFPFVFHWWCM